MRKQLAANDDRTFQTQWIGGKYPGILPPPPPPPLPKPKQKRARAKLANAEMIKLIDKYVKGGKKSTEISPLIGIRARTVRDIINRKGAYAEES